MQLPNNIGSPFVLQGFTRGSAKSPVHGKLGLQSNHGTVHRSSGGADLVAESPVSVEREDSGSRDRLKG